MKYRIASYQNGGFSQDFLDSLSSYAGQQDEPDQQDAPDEQPEEQQQQQDNAPQYDEEYINNLQQRYDDLEERLKSLEGAGNSNDDDQAFMNFLFDGSESNAPVNVDPQLFRPSASGFRSFDTPEEGRNALLNQLDLYQTGKTKTGVKPENTLYEAMAKYAPASDNNDPKAYAEFIAKSMGISPDTPISQIDKAQWADAITKMEGNKKGNNPGNLRSSKKRQYGGQEDLVSMLGYSDNSPYKNNSSLFINTPTGDITMENTSIPLLGVGNKGEKKIMLPGNKYKFNSNLVKEIPLR